MKKVVFVSQSLRIGGAQRALVNQLNNIDFSNYEVSLFLYSIHGEYLDLLDKRIKVCSGNKLLHCIGKTKNESRYSPICFILRNTLSLIAKLVGSDMLFSIIFLFQRRIKGYDIAVSYLHNLNNNSLYFGYNKFVLTKIESKQKIAWIHSDFETAKLNTKLNMMEYSKFDYVVNVSHAMMKKFNEITQFNINKSKVIYNIIPFNKIQELSVNKTNEIEIGFITLITLCRLDSNKSIIELLNVAKRINEDRIEFRWYFVGDGPLFMKASEFIRKNNLDNQVRLLGSRENPYPLIAQSDLFISGSISESFGLSIVESLTIGTPVLALKYDAIDEIVNESNGKVVSDFNEMFDELSYLLNHKEKLSNLKKSTKVINDYNNQNKQAIEEIFRKGDH